MISAIAWLLVGFAVASQMSINEAQVVSPIQPDASDPGSANLAHNNRPTSRTRYVAKPGSVIVHFDRGHDIQLLQYVMQDGRLATLYQRHPNHPANTQTPIPVNVDGSQRAASEMVPVINHDETIEVIDAKKRAKLMLVGSHLTVPLPDHELEGTVPSQKHHQQVAHTDSSDLSDDKLDVLATVAVDAIQAGSEIAELKMKKAGILLSKLKSKVSAKLHELPSIIESNLRDKSTVGQMHLDGEGNKVLPVEDNLHESESSNHLSSANHIPSQQLGSSLQRHREIQIAPIAAQQHQRSAMIGGG